MSERKSGEILSIGYWKATQRAGAHRTFQSVVKQL